MSMIQHVSPHTCMIIIPWLKFVLVLFQVQHFTAVVFSWTCDGRDGPWWFASWTLMVDYGSWTQPLFCQELTKHACGRCLLQPVWFKIVAIYSIAGTANIPKRNCWLLFWNQNWGWDWWFSSCVSPCTSKVYWSPWRRQTRCSAQRWWVLGEVKYRQFCCFSTSQGRVYRMFTWALAWDMPCFLSCTWYPSCKQICKKLQPKQLQRMTPQPPWPSPLEGGSRQNFATLKSNLWCWTHAFIIVLCFHPFIDWCYTWCREKGVCLRPLKIRCDWPSKIRYKDISRMLFQIVFSKWMVHSTDWVNSLPQKTALGRNDKKQVPEPCHVRTHAVFVPSLPGRDTTSFFSTMHKKGHATERNI